MASGPRIQAVKPLPVVLVVATDTITCDVVSTALEGQCAVMAATTLRAAWDAARARPPRIAILDSDLRPHDLDTLLQGLRLASPQVGFLLIAPRAGAPGISGQDPVLDRPIHPGQIAEAVKRLLGDATQDLIDELIARVHRSQTTRFER